MIAATKRWFRRNRNSLLIGAGVIGAGYLAGQYVLGKIQEARQRMSEDKIAKEKYETPMIPTEIPIAVRRHYATRTARLTGVVCY